MFTLLTAFALAAPVPAPTPDWVTIKGTVFWPAKADIPERKAYDLTNLKGGDIEYMRSGGAVYDDRIQIDADTRGLKNVVVWLRPDDDDPKAAFPAAKVHPDLAKVKAVTHTVSSRFCRFDKPVIAARAGDTLEFVNAGTVTIAPSLTLGDHQSTHTIRRDDRPTAVKGLKAGSGYFSDAVHPAWKADALQGLSPWGRICVFDHPYFAVTNETGEFELKDVPKGKWRIVYLHAGSGYHTGKVGRLGFVVDVEGDKKGVMAMKPLAFEKPK